MAPLPKPALTPTAAPEPAPAPPASFPTTALGPTLSAAATSIAARTQAPIELAAHHLLTLAAMAAQRLISLRLPTGASRPVSCYFLTLAGSGEGRSAVESAAVEPVRAAFDPTQRLRLALFADPRSPGNADRYRVTQTQSALFAGRCDAFIARGRARRAEALSLAGLWDGRVIPTTSLFTTPKPLHPRLSAHIVATPRDGLDIISDPTLADCGLLGRILCAAPASRIGERAWLPGNDDSAPELAGFHARVTALCVQEPTAHERYVGFTETATAQWFAFAQEMESGMRVGQAFAGIRPLAGRLADHAARLAAIIALIENETLTEIDEAALARGITLARFYASEALRMSDLAPVLATPTELTHELQVWLERTHMDRSVTLREVCRSGPPSVRDADLAYKVMRRLERLGVVRPRAELSDAAAGTRRAGVRYVWQVGSYTASASAADASSKVSRGVA